MIFQHCVQFFYITAMCIHTTWRRPSTAYTHQPSSDKISPQHDHWFLHQSSNYVAPSCHIPSGLHHPLMWLWKSETHAAGKSEGRKEHVANWTIQYTVHPKDAINQCLEQCRQHCPYRSKLHSPLVPTFLSIYTLANTLLCAALLLSLRLQLLNVWVVTQQTGKKQSRAQRWHNDTCNIFLFPFFTFYTCV